MNKDGVGKIIAIVIVLIIMTNACNLCVSHMNKDEGSDNIITTAKKKIR